MPEQLFVTNRLYPHKSHPLVNPHCLRYTSWKSVHSFVLQGTTRIRKGDETNKIHTKSVIV